MNRVVPFFVLAAAAGSALGQSWQLVWSDEFSPGAKIDTTKWRWETGGGGWGNQELETYTNTTSNSLITSSAGQGYLAIIGRRDSKGNYTSARLASNASWTYGRMDIRAWVPGGKGTWPAIWMLPAANTYGNLGWPDNGEIDIMEEVGYEGNITHGSFHNHSYNWMLGNGVTNSVTVPNMTTGFHIYSMIWQPTQIDILVDGVTYVTYHRKGADWKAWPWDKGFQFRLNMAIGGSWGGAQGVATTIWPRAFYVDYVRVSKAKSTRYGAANAIPGRITATNFDLGGEGFAYHDTTAGNTGSLFRTDGVDIGNSATEGNYVGWIDADEWLNYTVPVKTAGKYTFYARVSSPNVGKQFYLEVDDVKATKPITVPTTGDWNKFATVGLGNITLTAGTHKLRMVALTDGFNFGSLASRLVTP